MANIPISVKADSNVIANYSPYNLFISLPNGTSTSSRAENWYLKICGEPYQKLYSFIRENYCQSFPANVSDYHKIIKGKGRDVFSSIVQNLSVDDKQEFDKLYINLCHLVAELSASLFNHALEKTENSSIKNSVLEKVLGEFLRLSDTEYVLCGLDHNESFSVTIPDLTSWKRKWKLKRIIANPDLERGQSIVNFFLVIEDKTNKKETEIKFHSEIRWSHGKFKGNPEAKIYKEIKWVDLPFLTSIGSNLVVKLELIGSGGYGYVYRAKIRNTGEIVALKELSIQQSYHLKK